MRFTLFKYIANVLVIGYSVIPVISTNRDPRHYADFPRTIIYLYNFAYGTL